MLRDLTISRDQVDNMGMMATVINGLALQSVLDSVGVESVILSAIKCDRLVNESSTNNINHN